MASVRPWSVRAEGEVVPFPQGPRRGVGPIRHVLPGGTRAALQGSLLRHRQPADAEELMQEAFLRLWERWDRIDRIEDPTAYLFRVSLNAFRSRRRRAATALRKLTPVDEDPRRVRRCGDARRRAPAPARVHAAATSCSRARRPARVSVRAGGTHPGRASLDGSGPRDAGSTSDPRNGRSAGCLTMQEVFRLATNKVKPDPNALERQQRRQRRNDAARAALRAYLAVAAVIAVDRGRRDRDHEDRRTRRHEIPAEQRIPQSDDAHVRHGASLPARTRRRRRSSIFGGIRLGR